MAGFPICYSAQVVSICYFDVLVDPTVDLSCFYLLIPNRTLPSTEDEHEHLNFRDRARSIPTLKSRNSWSYLELPTDGIPTDGDLNLRNQDQYFAVFDHLNSVLKFKKTISFSEFVSHQYSDSSLIDFVLFPYIDDHFIDFIFAAHEFVMPPYLGLIPTDIIVDFPSVGSKPPDPNLFRLMNQPLKGGGDVMVLGSGLLRNKPRNDGRNPTKKVRIKPVI